MVTDNIQYNLQRDIIMTTATIFSLVADSRENIDCKITSNAMMEGS